MLYKMSYKEKINLGLRRGEPQSSKENVLATGLEPRSCQMSARGSAQYREGFRSVFLFIQPSFSNMYTARIPDRRCKTFCFSAATLRRVVMRRTTWSLGGASKVLPSLRELGNIVSLPPKLLQRLNKPPGSFPLNSREGGLPVMHLYLVYIHGLLTARLACLQRIFQDPAC